MQQGAGGINHLAQRGLQQLVAPGQGVLGDSLRGQPINSLQLTFCQNLPAQLIDTILNGC